MLSIQQLIKALRKLQKSAVSSGELIKSLNLATTATTTITENTSNIQGALVTSLLSANDAVTSPTSPKQQHQTTDSSRQKQQQVNCQNSPTASVSLQSHLNEDGSTCTITAQDSKLKYEKSAATLVLTSSSSSAAHLCRSQQIQNFYQTQLHHFHTQHNQSLYAKQKQTQFAMSSLAAEPIALKQQDDITATKISNGQNDAVGDDSSTNSKQNSSSLSSAASGKPCFNTTGFAEILKFMELIGNLKHTKRTGWVLRDVNDCESISGHMYRMSMMTFLLDGSEGLNPIRCMELALVHDLAESIVGDLTPFCGITREDKRAMEFKAMDDICKLIEPRGKRIMELFEEYEHGESNESKFVKDLDRLDMVMQAFEYEKRDNCLLKHQEFFDSTEGKFNHPFVKKVVEEIYEQRQDLAKSQGATPPPSIEVAWPNTSTGTPTTNGHSLEQQEKKSSTSS